MNIFFCLIILLVLSLKQVFCELSIASRDASTCDAYTSESNCMSGTEGGEDCSWCTSGAVGASCLKESDTQGLPSSIFHCEYQSSITKYNYDPEEVNKNILPKLNSQELNAVNDEISNIVPISYIYSLLMDYFSYIYETFYDDDNYEIYDDIEFSSYYYGDDDSKYTNGGENVVNSAFRMDDFKIDDIIPPNDISLDDFPPFDDENWNDDIWNDDIEEDDNVDDANQFNIWKTLTNVGK
jgi:hypothetical protein